ncbi:MAG: hypothetical protein F6K17_28160 [Okeania sp. SIO3C4]|nr:hypothetical protein [Okeania sp. SIO3C4]
MTIVQQMNQTSIYRKSAIATLIIISLKSKNYNVGVCWYLWREAMAEFDCI